MSVQPFAQAKSINGPPLPADSEEAWRWEHTAMRWRMLYGRHEQDVFLRIVGAVGSQRAKAWKPLDMSANPFSMAWEQSSALYQDEPSMQGPDPEVIAAVADSGWWSQMQRNQRDTLGLRELPVLCELDDDGMPRGHIILPHRCTIEAHPRRPGVCIAAHWWEPDPRNDAKWVQYHIDPRTPSYWVTDSDGKDVSVEVLGDVAGTYPWQYRGQPIQPVVLYHAAETGSTWDPYARIEVVEGTIMCALHYTHVGHAMRHAAWSQRYMVGVKVRGGETTSDGQAQQIVADAATVLDLEPDEEMPGTSQIGQWSSSANIEGMMSTARSYERRVIEQATGGGVEITRSTSDIRSGASLAVSREAQILGQERYAPVFRSADRRAMKIWSMLMSEDRNRDFAVDWPTTTGRMRATASGGTRPERDIEYSISNPVAGDIPTPA